MEAPVLHQATKRDTCSHRSEPLWGAFFAWTLLGEHWGPTGWVGAFLIVSATLWAQLKTGENEEVPEEERPTVPVEVYDTHSEQS